MKVSVFLLGFSCVGIMELIIWGDGSDLEGKEASWLGPMAGLIDKNLAKKKTHLLFLEVTPAEHEEQVSL